jgi:hypothetical protein
MTHSSRFRRWVLSSGIMSVPAGSGRGGASGAVRGLLLNTPALLRMQLGQVRGASWAALMYTNAVLCSNKHWGQ